MHRKNILFIQQNMQPYARFSKVAEELDVEFAVCYPTNVMNYLEKADLVVCAIDPARSNVTGELERTLQDAGETSMLLVVEPSGLRNLRLPSHIHVDFITTNATDDEVLVRIRHLLWPGEEASNADFITIDSMTINLSTYQVMVEGSPVDFTYLEYALLAFLVTHPGHAYSRDALLSRVWGFDYYGGSRTVDVHVRRVRAKLGAELAMHLRTVRGVGYMWE